VKVINIQNSGGNISSPNYPGQYPKNTDVTWIITITNGTKIAFWMIDMDIKNYYRCSREWVQVYDDPSLASPSLARFCGKTKGFPIVSSGASLVVRFSSFFIQQTGVRGFFAKYATADLGKRKFPINDRSYIVCPVYRHKSKRHVLFLITRLIV
jgi:hypothetical protein